MESLFVPTLIVALAEIGDKTQLLALLLAARFRKPWPIIAGIVAATLANHFAAGAVGAWVASFFSEATLELDPRRVLHRRRALDAGPGQARRRRVRAEEIRALPHHPDRLLPRRDG